MTKKHLRITALTAATLVAAVALAGCASSPEDKGDTGGAAKPDYQFWDPYPQYDASSAWAGVVNKCGDEAGVTIKRTATDTTELLSKALLGAQQNNSPDVIVIDNATIATLAEAGAIVPNTTTGLSTEGALENILDAAVLDGETYGTPLGANGTAIYYNKTILADAGVDPAGITDWATLNDALAKVAAIGKMPITFSAVATAEGTFQFDPWFWGAGADLTNLDSPEAIEALTLWTDWVKQGWAPTSALNNNQFVSFEQFTTGDYAFAQNGPWEVPFAVEAGIDYGIMSIPAKDGGLAQTAIGGEFLALPIQLDTSRYETSSKLVRCLTEADNSLVSNEALQYVAPSTEAQEKQIAANPEFEVWVDTINAGKMRTGDGLGTKFPIIDQQLWTALQNSLSGSMTPTDALKNAQDLAEKDLASQGE